MFEVSKMILSAIVLFYTSIKFSLDGKKHEHTKVLSLAVHTVYSCGKENPILLRIAHRQWIIGSFEFEGEK